MSSLEKEIASKLKKLNKTLSIAESCTGGSICSKIVSNPGASTYFKGGVVCYSTESKVNILGIDRDLIDKKSVVSVEVAEMMAKKVKKMFNTDFAIGTTGNIGLTEGDSDAPIGKVYISIANNEIINTLEFDIKGDREYIIKMVVEKTFELLKNLINHQKIKKIL